MVVQKLCFVLLFLHLQRDIIVSATTSIVFYADDACRESYITVKTDTNAGNGDCGEASGANSAILSTLIRGCSGIKRLRAASNALTNNAISDDLLRLLFKY